MHDLDVALDGIAQRVERAAGFAVIASDDKIGVIDHVPVALHHAAGGVMVLQYGDGIAAREKGFVPLPLRRAPVLRLSGERDGGFKRYIGVILAQRENSLAEIEIAPLGHTADEPVKAGFVYRFQRIVQRPFQSPAARIVFVIAPWQLFGPVARKGAGRLAHAHHILLPLL